MRSKHCDKVLGLAALLTAAVSASPAHADPCGMVPPISIVQGDPIVRQGLQKTYVAYKNGIETMVLRPGFSGKVDEFGMLIPFPSPPAIRKADEDTFTQIAAAIDPPEVVVYVGPRPMPSRSRAAGAPSAASKSSDDEAGLRYDEVRVVRQEAIGMYEVAVLEAGSAHALKTWMDDKGFRYPTGMDAVTNEYVAAGWYFVAIKTRVGQLAGVNPHPGMRKADAKLPAGSTFDGHVQAMGFRFQSKELVVPMRLSAFNKGELRNVVYILADHPMRIENIPQRYVVRQLSGVELYRNVTSPLPLRVLGGTIDMIPAWQRDSLKMQRDPAPHNGIAKQLFASDLLAIRSKRLANPEEETEKQLLSIGERLGLRGLAIDNLHREVLAKERAKGSDRALADIKQMTLTVVDGDFPREVIAGENLRFAMHRMPAKRNSREFYDARMFGPAGPNQGGKLYRRSAALDPQLRPDGAPARHSTDHGVGFGVVLIFAGLGWRRRGRRRASSRIGLALGLLLLAGLVAGGAALASPPAKAGTNIEGWIRQLADENQRTSAMGSLVQAGQRAVDPLLDEVVDGDDMVRKGWAVVTLVEIGGERVDLELTKLHSGTQHSMLVRTWAAAGRVALARDTDALLALAPLAASFPGVERPLGMRLAASISDIKGPDAAEKLLAIAMRAPALTQEIQPAVMALGAGPLVRAMLHSTDVNVRRSAAGYLGALAPKPDSGVAKHVIAALRFKRGAERTPWDGGALFIPAIQWSRDDAQALVDSLLRWHLWADLRGQNEPQNQIHNNLRSIQLAQAAGYASPGWQNVPTVQWLKAWRQVVGSPRIRAMLRQQGVRWERRYRAAIYD